MDFNIIPGLNNWAQYVPRVQVGDDGKLYYIQIYKTQPNSLNCRQVDLA